MGTERVQIVGWFVGVVMPVEQIFFCLGCLVGPVQNIFLLTVHYSYVSITQQAGQAAVLGRLSLSMCLWVEGGLNENYAQGFFIGILLPPANTARMSTNLILLRWLTLTLFLLPVYQSCRR